MGKHDNNVTLGSMLEYLENSSKTTNQKEVPVMVFFENKSSDKSITNIFAPISGVVYNDGDLQFHVSLPHHPINSEDLLKELQELENSNLNSGTPVSLLITGLDINLTSSFNEIQTDDNQVLFTVNYTDEDFGQLLIELIASSEGEEVDMLPQEEVEETLEKMNQLLSTGQILVFDLNNSILQEPISFGINGRCIQINYSKD